jgi:hypothetical protein
VSEDRKERPRRRHEGKNPWKSRINENKNKNKNKNNQKEN